MPATITLAEANTFQLSYDPVGKLLRGRWPAPVLNADLRAHYAELLAQAQTHGRCGYWLLDMRHRNWYMPSFGAWFGTEFAAAVQAALGRPVFIAYVLGPRHQTAVEGARAQATQRACSRHNLYPYYFASEEDALDWLRHQQALS